MGATIVRPPQQKRSEATRARILSEARRQFAARGFDATNVRDIAEAAGSTHSMIRYHFGTKDQLWREAVRQMFETLHQATAAPEEEAEQPKAERLKAFITRYVRYCAQYPEHAWITIQETISGGERLDWMVENFVKTNHSDVLEFLDDLMAERILPQCDPISMIYSIAGMAQLPFVLTKESELSFGVNMLDEARIDIQVETVTKLLFREV